MTFKERIQYYIKEEGLPPEPSALPTGAPQGQADLPPDTTSSAKSADTYGALSLAVSFLLFPKADDIDTLITPDEKQYLFDIEDKGIQSEEDKSKVLDILGKFNLNV